MIPFNSIVLLGLAFFLLIVLLRTIKIVPQKQVKIIERLGRYHRTAEAGLNTVLPFLDSVRETIDQREQRQAMSRYDDRHLFRRERLQPLQKLGLAADVEVGRGLVEKEDAWPPDQDPRKPDRLFLATR